jgi:hypothetical protein
MQVEKFVLGPDKQIDNICISKQILLFVTLHTVLYCLFIQISVPDPDP